jgi:DNA-directed RNA polymerase subunit alpha
MRIRWRGLELPTQVVKDVLVSTDTYGRFLIEPFERGFGTTVGNSLRRILLSSLEGAAVCRVRIAGADHEFMSLPGVLEDVTDMILNIKSLIVRFEGEGEKTMRVTRTGKGEVRAADIEADPAITIINGDQLIATLTDNVTLDIEFWVASGRGYRTAEENAAPEGELGTIAVDSVFSPVTRVRYRTEDTRVGQRTNYDRLVMEVWTKGTVKPEDALVEAAKILRKHLNPFVQYFDIGEETITEGAEEVAAEPAGVDDELRKKLSMSISQLELSVRASNCLESAKIDTVGMLVQKTESDLLKLRSFGKTSLREVKRKLADIGLSLGMSVAAEGAPAPDAPAEAGLVPGAMSSAEAAPVG